MKRPAASSRTQVPIDEREGTLAAPPPERGVEDARRIAVELFGIEGSLTSLESERDRNFRVDAEDGRFLLKIHNGAEGPGVVEMQENAIEHVAAADPSL